VRKKKAIPFAGTPQAQPQNNGLVQTAAQGSNLLKKIAPTQVGSLPGVIPTTIAPETGIVTGNIGYTGAGLESGGTIATGQMSAVGDTVIANALPVEAPATTGITGTVGGIVGSVASYAPYVAAAKGLGTVTRGITGDKAGDKMDYLSRMGRVAEKADEGVFEPVAEELGGGDTVTGYASNAQHFLNPAGSIVKKLKDTWLCTEVAKYVGLTKDDHKILRKLRRYAITNYRSQSQKYFDNGNKLVDAINLREVEQSFYERLKEDMVEPVIQLIQSGNLEKAYKKYEQDTLALIREYAPEIEEN
jgi:hypothetical protein